MPNTGDLQPLAADPAGPMVALRMAKIQPSLTNAVWSSDVSISYRYQLNTRCQDFITRYLGRSLVAVVPNDPNIGQVNRKLLELTFTVSLMTLILSYEMKMEEDHPSCVQA